MKRLSVLLLLALLWARAAAQDVSFQAAVDKNPVGLGDQVTLSLTLGSASVGGGKNLQLPDLAKFQILSGPNQSTQMQFINGAVSSQVTYSYVLQPRELGKFTIGPASIEVGNAVYKTAPIDLEVVKGTPRPRQQAQQPVDAGEQIGDNLFLRAVVDRSHVIQGEQVNLLFKLYTRVSVANYGIEKNPTMAGFWSEDIEIPKNIALTTEVVNGKQYRVGTIRKLALFPTQSGTLEIAPMEVTTTVQVRTRSLDPFDAFFRDPFGQTITHKIKSDPVRIKVDPLPLGAPSGFKGAIGRFTMKAAVDKSTTKTNESISLKITISGTGNIKLLESPEVELPKDFEQYTPKVTDNISRQQDRISGTKTFEYLLIPRYPGQKVIKPVQFVYFDLGKKSYATLESQRIDLTVEQGPAQLAPLTLGGSRENVSLLSQDIRFIKVSGDGLTRGGESVPLGGMFVALLLLPLAGFAGAFVYARQRHAEMLDEAGYRNRRAMKVANKGLKHAEQLLKARDAATAQNAAKFYAEVSRAMYQYLGDKLNIQQADMSIDTVTGELERRSVNGDQTGVLKSFLESCEMTRFVPSGTGIAGMQETYNTAKKIIVDLERVLRSR